MLSRAKPEGGVEHRLHNESRVLIKRDGRWQIVHVHKSPAWQAPFESNKHLVESPQTRYNTRARRTFSAGSHMVR